MDSVVVVSARDVDSGQCSVIGPESLLAQLKTNVGKTSSLNEFKSKPSEIIAFLFQHGYSISSQGYDAQNKIIYWKFAKSTSNSKPMSSIPSCFFVTASLLALFIAYLYSY